MCGRRVGVPLVRLPTTAAAIACERVVDHFRTKRALGLAAPLLPLITSQFRFVGLQKTKIN